MPGEQTQIEHASFGYPGLSQVLTTFQFGDYEEKLAAAQKFGRLQKTGAQGITGDMFLELAFEQPNPDAALELFAEADSHWNRAIGLHEAGEGHGEGFGAAFSLAQRDLYQWRLLAPEILPPASVVEKSYTQMLDLALGMTEELSSQVQRVKSDYNMTVTGQLAEVEAWLLLQRFGLQLGDGSWLATSSSFTEDRGNAAYRRRTSWDISVWTQTDTESAPERAYKVQIKTTANGNSCIYNEDVALVNLCDDMALPNSHGQTRRIPLGTIARECASEQAGSEHATRRLDQRTEKLLDILG